MCEAPTEEDSYVRSTSSGHCCRSLDTFPAMLGPYRKSCESCYFDNKPKNLLFQNWIVIDISSAFAARFFLQVETFYTENLYLHSVSDICFSYAIF